MKGTLSVFLIMLLTSFTAYSQTYISFSYQSPPVPLASAGNDIQTICGTAFNLQGVVTGGTAPFIISWTPAAYLNNASILNPIGTVPISTTFLMMVTDVNGCQSVDSVRVNCQNVGVEEDVWDEIAIYPNPSEGYFRIEGIPSFEDKLVLSCQSVTGIEVFRSELPPGSRYFDLNLSGLAPGIYCLSLQGKSSRMLHKIIIL
jgi:hypothetical protein